MKSNAVILLMVTTGILASAGAAAQAITDSGSVIAPNGKTVVSYNGLTTNTGTVTHNGTITGPAGGQTQVNASENVSNGALRDQGSITGPGGRSATFNGQTTLSGDTLQHTGTITGPNGQVTDVDRTTTLNSTVHSNRSERQEHVGQRYRPVQQRCVARPGRCNRPRGQDHRLPWTDRAERKHAQSYGYDYSARRAGHHS